MSTICNINKNISIRNQLRKFKKQFNCSVNEVFESTRFLFLFVLRPLEDYFKVLCEAVPRMAIAFFKKSETAPEPPPPSRFRSASGGTFQAGGGNNVPVV